MWRWVVAGLGLLVAGCAGTTSPTGKPTGLEVRQSPQGHSLAELEELVDRHVREVAGLTHQLNLAFWTAVTEGDAEAARSAARMETRIKRLFGTSGLLVRVKGLQAEAGQVPPSLQRRLQVLMRFHEENRGEPRLLAELDVTQRALPARFLKTRVVLNGKQIDASQAQAILTTEPDPSRRKDAWKAFMARGAAVAEDLLGLIRLRNDYARSLGYPNYYHLCLDQAEQDPRKIQAMLEKLARQTDAPFTAVMKQVKLDLALRFGIQTDQLRPWHMEDPHFQRAPMAGRLPLDTLFRGKDLKRVVQAYFESLGLNPLPILERSFLGGVANDRPFSFAIDMDREGDVRVFAGLVATERSAATLLHETGHALYFAHIGRNIPWILRTPAHPVVSEAVARLFSRKTHDPGWLRKYLGADEKRLADAADEINEDLRRSLLVSARWNLLVAHFERELYRDPDQDLNALWWELKSRYQHLKPIEGRNAPDWATVFRLIEAPVTHQNLVLAELLASQLEAHLARRKNAGGDLEFGQLLLEKLFSPGASLGWTELLVRALGEGLDSGYFLKQIDHRPGDRVVRDESGR